MKCPKCEEGTLKKLELNRPEAFCILCDFCNTYWEKDERLDQTTGKPFKDITDSDVSEFNLKPLGEVDQEHDDSSYTHVR